MDVYIDADPIVYRNGYASERSEYEVLFEDVEGEPHWSIWDDGNEKLKYFRANPKFFILREDKNVYPEPEEYCLELVNVTVQSILKEISSHYDTTVRPHLYLSGPDNFRIALATVREYKGSRKDAKPYHYQNIRDYLYRAWGAEVVEGREADDEVSIRTRANPGSVVATIDKDLDQIPGFHFDYLRKVHYDVDESEARRWFWVQALSGDSGDDIPGCFRIGPTGAEKLIDKWIAEWSDHTRSNATVEQLEKFLWARLVKEYEASKGRETERLKCPYIDRDSYEVALEMARLVKMQEYAGQLWTPPGEPDEMLENMV